MNNGIRAVLYVRVSTDEQADDPLNLSNQEQKCRNYCEQRGYEVVWVFIDSGESARTADRPEFQRMVNFCKTHRRDVGYVVVQDLSRFARNNGDQAQFIAELAKHGVRLCSVYEPNVDETAAGKLAANIHGTFNQFFSDSLSEKMKDRSRAAVLAGRFPWPAPLGYLNNSKSGSGANLVPDPERASLLRTAFELIASGEYTKAKVLAIITEQGLRTRKGNKLSAQTFEKTLKKMVYCGYISASCLNAPVKGKHEPIVSEELFRAVQDVLNGKARNGPPQRKCNPNFPLKLATRCAACGTPITGGLATGKNKNRKFGYYWCRKRGCRSVKVRREEVEATFHAHLNSLQPDEQSIAEFPRIAEQAWRKKQGDAEEIAKRQNARLAELKVLKSELLRAKLRGEVPQSDYAQLNAEFDLEAAEIDAELLSVAKNRVSPEAFVRFAKAMQLDIGEAWWHAGAEQKQRVQNFLFQGDLRYSQELRKFEHPNPCLFNTMEEMGHKDWWLASPTGFEPVLPP
jgi:site-specific DNA recombinase